mmetsp:Transcript_55981/g.135432  ORF Transcript_55981/g.135432 Transcript_55981/m.135432 type:complete len:321 (+) Transcript_55981:321-1283(+)
MTSFSYDDGRDTTSSATHCSSSLPRPPAVVASSFLLSGQSQQQQSRRMLKLQRRRRDNRTSNNNNNKSDCLDSTRHSSASSIGTRNSSSENGKGLSTVVALSPVLVPSTSSSSSTSSSTSSTSVLTVTPGLDRTDHSSLTSSTSVTTTEDMIVKRVDENIPQATRNERITNRYIDFSSDDDGIDDDDNSLGSFGFNDSDDGEGGDDNFDANLGVNEEANHVVEKLASSLSTAHVHCQQHQQHQQQQGHKQPKFQYQRNQQSFHDSTVSFSSHLTEVIDVVPNLSPKSKGKYFYSYDELSEFRVEYEFELEGLLPPGSDES